MVAQYTQTQSVAKAKSTTAVPAMTLGVVLGTLFVWLGGFAGLVALAMWPLGVALSLVGASWWSYRQHEEAQWGMAIAGQLLGAVAIGLLWVASIL